MPNADRAPGSDGLEPRVRHDAAGFLDRRAILPLVAERRLLGIVAHLARPDEPGHRPAPSFEVPRPMKLASAIDGAPWLNRLLDALSDPKRSRRTVAVVLVLYCAVWTLYAVLAKLSQDIHFDMGEMVSWSRELALGTPKHPPLPAWLANRLSNVDMNSDRLAAFLEHLALEDTAKSRAILVKADRVADVVGLNDELLDGLLVGLRLE